MVSHVSEWPAVVVCEPNEALLVSLCDHLAADHFNVLPAPSASDALRLCRHSDPDVMLLEMALPDASGFDVLRAIRHVDGTASGIDSRLPILVVGAGNVDRVRALDEGADDYLSKPTTYGELRARIIAVLRRRRPQPEGPTRVGEIVVDPTRRKVLVSEREVRLSKKEFNLLRVLASDPTRVFTKDELMRSVWGRSPEVATRTLDAHASRLRRKLDPEFTRYVINCWGIGYRLIDG